MNEIKTIIILLHRYLGIAIGLLFVTWFASGIVMIYTGGMPRLTVEQRFQHLEAIDFSSIHITPAQAAKTSGSESSPKLLTFLGRPAYRFEGQSEAAFVVFADTGGVTASVSPKSVPEIISKFSGVDQSLISFVASISEPDQWTLGLRRDLPLEKYSLNDTFGTEVYVSLIKGEVVLTTTKRDRVLAWMGAIPHWLYFLPLRKNSSLWNQTVIWLATIGCVLAVLGLLLAVIQFNHAFKPTRPFNLSRSIRYRGLIRWHYILGFVFGIFALTWVFSGLLSMEPYRWSNARGLSMPEAIFSGGELQLGQFDKISDQSDISAWQTIARSGDVKEIEFVRIQGEHYYVLRQKNRVFRGDTSEGGDLNERVMEGGQQSGRILISAQGLVPRLASFSVESILDRLNRSSLEWPVSSYQLMTEYDSYYYSQDSSSPLPVLQVKFNDPAKTWYYIDPNFSEFVWQSHRLGRVERWLYNGLHSLDFSFWYSNRPIWDAVMIFLSLGGLAMSGIGLTLGVKKLLLPGFKQ